MPNKKWKNGLLRSGLPLEHVVAEQLSRKNYSIDSDFSFLRIDEKANEKEFSVDIDASRVLDVDGVPCCKATLDILVECKYRAPHKEWVFAPSARSGHGSGAFGNALRCFDQFSRLLVPRSPIQDAEDRLSWCSKGIELDPNGGAGHADGIRHGATQLQYAMVHLFDECAVHYGIRKRAELRPFFFLPILVTTANLRLLNKSTSLSALEDAESLQAVSSTVPYLVVSNPIGPLLAKWVRSRLGDLHGLTFSNRRLSELDQAREALRTDGLLPDESARGFTDALKHGNRHSLTCWLGCCLVCNLENLQGLVRDQEEVVLKCLSEARHMDEPAVATQGKGRLADESL